VDDEDDVESMSVEELRAEVRRLRRPDWHVHYWGGVRHFTHSHPAQTDEHDHHGYSVSFKIGQPTMLLRNGRRLEGEVTPIEVLAR